MRCSKCGKEIQAGMRLCQFCGTPVPQKNQQTNQWNREAAEKPAGGGRPSAKTASGSRKKSKLWLIPVLLLAVLALGAGVYFLFFHGKVNVNDYLVPTVSGEDGNYSVRIGLDAARMVRDNRDKFAVTDENRPKIKTYLKQTFPSLSTDLLVEEAVRNELNMALDKGTGSGNVDLQLTEDETLAKLAILAALADRTTPGGDRGPGNTLYPEVKNGYLNRSTGLSRGDTIRFSWSGADTGKVAELFGAKLSCGDAEFALKGVEVAAVPTTAVPTTEAPTTEAPTTEAPTTEAPTTEAPTTEAPTTEAPTTEAPTTEAPTTEAPTTEAPTTEAPTTEAPTTEAPTTEAPTTEAPTTEAPTTPVPVTLRVGDIVTFGHYEQDNNYSNGPEEIEWMVMGVFDDYVDLISLYILDVVPFNQNYTWVTYSSSSINQYLTGTFYWNAFMDAERAVMLDHEIPPRMNPKYSNTDQGSAVTELVYLSAVSKVTEFLPTDAARRCAGTPYAVAQGLHVNEMGFSPWWTRTMGSDNYHAVIVRSSGEVNFEGWDVTGAEYFDIGVRPAIRVRPDAPLGKR
nr:zinc-ribbon domain-containing protein [Lachnospiraceae bacterium]